MPGWYPLNRLFNFAEKSFVFGNSGNRSLHVFQRLELVREKILQFRAIDLAS